MRKPILFLFSCLLFVGFYPSIAQMYPTILPEKQRAAVIDEILEDRMNNLLPSLMRQAGIDTWVIISREYNEDPVMKTMLPSVWLSARRRTIFVFHDLGPEKGVERTAIARYDVGNLLKGAWDLQTNPDQWDALIDLLKKQNPAKIGLNFSKYFGHADGLTYTEHSELMAKLPKNLKDKVVSASDLAVSWLETRTEKEMVLYESISQISHAIIEEAFSEKVIQPGVTTTEDVVWWMRQKVTDMGLETWFHPTVDIQRNKEALKSHIESFSKAKADEIILPTETGEMGVLKNHAPIITGLDVGAMLVRTKEEWNSYALMGGFAVVKKNKVTILANEAESAQTINAEEAKNAFEIAKANLEKAEGVKQKVEANFAYKRAKARFQVVKVVNKLS